jgi:hypothetical protein
VLVTIRRLEKTQRAVALYRPHPEYESSLDISNIIKRILK